MFKEIRDDHIGIFDDYFGAQMCDDYINYYKYSILIMSFIYFMSNPKKLYIYTKNLLILWIPSIISLIIAFYLFILERLSLNPVKIEKYCKF